VACAAPGWAPVLHPVYDILPACQHWFKNPSWKALPLDTSLYPITNSCIVFRSEFGVYGERYDVNGNSPFACRLAPTNEICNM